MSCHGSPSQATKTSVNPHVKPHERAQAKVGRTEPSTLRTCYSSLWVRSPLFAGLALLVQVLQHQKYKTYSPISYTPMAKGGAELQVRFLCHRLLTRTREQQAAQTYLATTRRTLQVPFFPLSDLSELATFLHKALCWGLVVVRFFSLLNRKKRRGWASGQQSRTQTLSWENGSEIEGQGR